MASQRLTKSDRDFIAANFIKPIESKFESKKKELTEIIDALFKAQIPFDIIEFDKKYPTLLKRSNFYISDLFNLKYTLSLRLNWNIVEYFQVESIVFKRMKDEILNSSSIKSILTEMDAIRADRQRIKNQTICILEDINTTKQLKDQFPEGYAILMSCSVTSACDDIEKLRAEWSKYMK